MRKPTLVIDWDGTLAFSEIEEQDSREQTEAEQEFREQPKYKPTGIIETDRNGVNGRVLLYIRPHAESFLAASTESYRLVLWSFGVRKYIEECLSSSGLRDFFGNRVITREDMSSPFKDLAMVKRDLTRIAIVDDNNAAFGLLNPYNCVDVSGWSSQSYRDQFLKILLDLVDFHFKYVLSRCSASDLILLRETMIKRLAKRSSMRNRRSR